MTRLIRHCGTVNFGGGNNNLNYGGKAFVVREERDFMRPRMIDGWHVAA